MSTSSLIQVLCQSFRLGAFAGLIGFVPIFAQERQNAELQPRFRISQPVITGSLELGTNYYLEENFLDPDDQFFFESELNVDIAGSLGDSIQYFVSPRLTYHSDDLVESQFEFNESDEERPIFTFREAFVEGYFNDFQLSFGKRIYTWGTGDGLRPTDVINPRDFLVIPEAEKNGVVSGSLVYDHDSFSVEVVFVPLFSPARTPEFDNRWFTDPTEIIDLYESNFGFPPVFEFPARQIPGRSWDNVQGGVRLSSSSILSGWDLNLNYYRGIDSVGTFEVTSLDPLELTREFFKYHMAGASFSTTWGDFEFHGEAAYFDWDNNRLEEDFFSYIAGINYTWNEPVPGFLEEIFIVAEYAKEEVTRDRTFIFLVEPGVDRGLTNTFLGRIQFQFVEDTELQISGAYNFDNKDYSASGTISHKITDDFHIEAAANFYWGPIDSFFGAWRRNDVISSRLSYYF